MEPQSPATPSNPTPERRNRHLLAACGLAGLALGAYVYEHRVRPALREWGGSPLEEATRYPGDELVPGATKRTTCALTIQAPPTDVWPWLIQMGHRRGGWYAYDLVDNGGRRSAQRILAEHQTLYEGDTLPVDDRSDCGLRVAKMAQDRHLVFTWSPPTDTTDPKTLPVAPSAVWSFHLQTHGTHGCRLVVRTVGGRRHPLALAAGRPLSDHFAPVLQRKLLQGVKMRAERLYRIHRGRARRMARSSPPEA